MSASTFSFAVEVTAALRAANGPQTINDLCVTILGLPSHSVPGALLQGMRTTLTHMRNDDLIKYEPRVGWRLVGG